MLETIWFIVWGILWAVYLVLGGLDLGGGMLYPLLGRSEADRRAIHSALAPFWDGNQVWLITAGGVTFAAFPTTYAVMFSSLYTPLMILLFALILRAVAFEFRDKLSSSSWRALWDAILAIGSLIPAVLLGVAFANLFRGIPVDETGAYHGTLFTLLNPYGLLGGILFVLLLSQHGALWLGILLRGELGARATVWAKRIWPLAVIGAVVFLVLTAVETRLFQNYLNIPLLFLVPIVAVFSLLAFRLALQRGRLWQAWALSSVTVGTTTLFGIIGMYPNMILSTVDPSFSITVAKGASSPLTLTLMLAVSIVFVPIVIAYQVWAYKRFIAKGSATPLEEEVY